MKLEQPIENQEELRNNIPSGKLAVSEIFYSIMGEGRFSGRPMVFVRLNMCRVKCQFCDTSYTWKKITHNSFMSPSEIFDRAKELAPKCKFVCITGGEPFEQGEQLYELCKHLSSNGMKVQIETSGSMIINSKFKEVTNHIVCSPKMFNGLNHGAPISEVKLLIRFNTKSEKLKEFISRFHSNVYVTLQPYEPSPLPEGNLDGMSEEEIKQHKERVLDNHVKESDEWERNIQKATEIALASGWSLSLQTHKALRIR